MEAAGILRSPGIRAASVTLALLLAAAVGAGCARKSGESRDGADSTAAGAPRDTVIARDPFDERPAALFGPAIGARDPVIESLRADLAEWAVLWQAARPEFRIDSLRAGGSVDFHPAPDAMPWPFPGVASDGEGPESSPAMVRRAPGGRYALLIDRYLDLSSGGEIAREPDSAPVLLDRATGVTSTFEFCGTPCRFDWGAWVDSTRFLLGGRAYTGLEGGGAYGTLGLYDLRAGRTTTWYVPDCDSVSLERYDHAWAEWVRRRARKRDVAATPTPAFGMPALVGAGAGI